MRLSLLTIKGLAGIPKGKENTLLPQVVIREKTNGEEGGKVMFHVELELDSIIDQAVSLKASDVHFDAARQGLIIRFRIDGLLETISTVAPACQDKLINRIKVLSGLDIGEKRVPQDGRWEWRADGKEAVMRVATIPSVFGETIVCRLLGSCALERDLNGLGMDGELAGQVASLLQRPSGLLVVSGPTGSGKTSTLYALLNTIDRVRENVICLENPVEAEIRGAVQVQINEKAGLTFASGLRAILRQDPDTILVGEIRDRETAQLAIQAALTGHRVLSTIHTDRAADVRGRLINMGAEEYLLEAVFNGALAQRLVRRPCRCSGEGGKSGESGTVCSFCRGSGYAGRTALYELLAVPPRPCAKEALAGRIVRTLAESGRLAIEAGITTDEEVRRVGAGCE